MQMFINSAMKYVISVSPYEICITDKTDNSNKKIININPHTHPYLYIYNKEYFVPLVHISSARPMLVYQNRKHEKCMKHL